MKRYEILCTKSQIRKAIRLGAPIKDCEVTAEQMLGWLEEKFKLRIDVDLEEDCSDDADGNIADRWDYYCFYIYIGHKCMYYGDMDQYDTSRDATLAGIDKAFDILKELNNY